MSNNDILQTWGQITKYLGVSDYRTALSRLQKWGVQVRYEGKWVTISKRELDEKRGVVGQ